MADAVIERRGALGRRWAALPLRAKGLCVLSLPLAMLVVTGAIFFVTTAQARDAQRSVTHARVVQEQIADVRQLVAAQQTYVLGNLLSRERLFADRARRAGREVSLAVDRLAPPVAGDPAQSARVARLRALLARRPQPSPVGGPSGDADAERTWLLSQQASMDAIAAELTAMRTTEARLLEARLARRDFWQAWASVGVGGALCLGFVGGLLVMGAFPRGVASRVERLKQNAELLAAGEVMTAPPNSGDELDMLSRGLQQTVDLLRARDREITDARAFLENILTVGPAVVMRWDAGTQAITYVSPNCERVLGVSPEQAADLTCWRRVWTDEDLVSLRLAVADLLSGQATTRVLEMHGEIGGRTRFLAATLTAESPVGVTAGEQADGVERHPEPDPERSAAVLAYIADVSERRRAELELADRQRRLQAITAASPDVITTLDHDLRVTWVSPTVRSALGYRPDERIGASELDVVAAADHARVVEAVHAVAAGRRNEFTLRYRVRHADGHLIPVESRGRPLCDLQGSHLSGVLVVSRDISLQMALEEESRMAREEAEAANQAKSEFLSRMSHELRTPLNAVLGFAQLLEMDVEEDQRASVRQIRRAGSHLLDLINEVLDIAQIETGRLALSPEPVLVSDLIDEAVDVMRPLATAQGVVIDRHVGPESRRHVRADRQRSKQVVLNLLSNAVKYNRPGGRVSVRSAVIDDARLAISVQDTGVGIAPADLPRLFTPFERLSAAGSDVEGTGVGLALTRRLVRAMGGTIGVESRVGEGTTFTVCLPLTAPTTLEASSLAEPASDVPVRNHPGATVVYIEDNQSNLRLLEQILRRRPGWRLVHAAHGSLGLELATATGPELVLLDLHLPDMSGIEVLRHLRADPATAEAQIVIISADATPGQVERLRAAGADRYITKPIDVAELLGLLDEVASKPRGEDGD